MTKFTLSAQWSLRLGAASAFLIIGLVFGLILASAVAAAGDTSNFGKLVFSTAIFAALMAGAFPDPALASILPALHLLWGVLGGLTLELTDGNIRPSSSRVARWFFWFGFVIGSLLLVLWASS